MKRLNERTVALTEDGEVEAHEQFQTLLDEGYGIAAAKAHVRLNWPDLSDEYWNWLG